MKDINSGINRASITIAFVIIGIRSLVKLFDVVDDYSRNFLEEIIIPLRNCVYAVVVIPFRKINAFIQEVLIPRCP